jgi:hypothetical protein
LDYIDRYIKVAIKVLDRDLFAVEGLSSSEVKKAEDRLGLKLPKTMVDYYLIAGNCRELNLYHNPLYSLDKLKVEEGFLWFIKENQEVVRWGIKTKDLADQDPRVWQRNNDTNEWCRKNLSFSTFIEKMWLWQAGLDPGN